jgi:hypothetical protein
MTGGGNSFEICNFCGKLKLFIGKTSSMVGHIWHALFAVKTCSGTDPYFLWHSWLWKFILFQAFSNRALCHIHLGAFPQGL